MTEGLEIIDLFAEAVKAVAGCEVEYDGKVIELDGVNYIFGSAQYLKDMLDRTSVAPVTKDIKFPLVCLFTPVNEERNSLEYYTQASCNLIIACSTCKEWSNEERSVTSFKNILRPIYRRLLEVLESDNRLDFGYDGCMEHEYSENYSYGRYGAYTDNGDMVSEPIDAINIRNLKIKVKSIKCKRQ